MDVAKHRITLAGFSACPIFTCLHDFWPNEVFVSLIPNGIPESHRAIAQEADRIHESALWSAQGQFEQAKLWRLINLTLGVPAAALAAISGGTALGGDLGVWPGVLALISAAFSATLTTVNASRRMTQAQASANAYLQLQTAARQFLTIDLADMSHEDARDTLRNLTNTRDELNKTSDPPGRLAYKKSSKNISGGGQSYTTDEGE
ncbi:SLATT domain-containing protein [Streptomyces durhamensis]|uniref:SLATT domain-containing protein n=1 Tax=Streptomyces durhamensis TaxID=68194 RepID=UPI001428D5FD|nr:SLATT domain-containing protein [Streptomyces durhamensis]